MAKAAAAKEQAEYDKLIALREKERKQIEAQEAMERQQQQPDTNTK